MNEANYSTMARWGIISALSSRSTKNGQLIGTHFRISVILQLHNRIMLNRKSTNVGFADCSLSKKAEWLKVTPTEFYR
jgi:hypothetical protein